jgi:hypothetical protein
MPARQRTWSTSTFLIPPKGAWKIARRDGVVLGFTDHVLDLR